jgi:ATP-dependent protease HslVU (ClpYQ) peptidase subunit
VHDERLVAFVRGSTSVMARGAGAADFAHNYRLNPETRTLPAAAAAAPNDPAAFCRHHLQCGDELLAIGIGRPFQKASAKAVGRIKRLIADRLSGE